MRCVSGADPPGRFPYIDCSIHPFRVTDCQRKKLSDGGPMMAPGEAAPSKQPSDDPLLILTREHGVLDQTTPEDVRAIAKAVVRADHSVIHVHGGLVSSTHAIEAGTRLGAVYRPALLP